MSKEFSAVQRLELIRVFYCELLKRLHMANEAAKDIERQLRSTGISPELDSALNVMCAQMELAECLAKKAKRTAWLNGKKEQAGQANE